MALTKPVILRSVNGPDATVVEGAQASAGGIGEGAIRCAYCGDGDGVARYDMGAYEFNPYRFGPMLRPDSTGFSFTVHGEPGKSVRIERSRDLVTWEHVADDWKKVNASPTTKTAEDHLLPLVFYQSLRARDAGRAKVKDGG